MTIGVRPVCDHLGFGSRVTGVTREAILDQEVRGQLVRLLEDRGLIVFEDVEQTTEFQLELSKVFGPLKQHPVKIVPKLDENAAPGVIELQNDKDGGAIVEIAGELLATWQPWHFDHCYNNELNRAGVLRSVVIPPEGGETGFADGIQLYNAISPELRSRIEDKNVIYTLNLLYRFWRFGRVKDFREVRPHAEDILTAAKALPRAIHPAVWTRASGEKVLHCSGWYAVGIEGMENEEGDALFEAVCQEMLEKIEPYHHKWQPGDMLIWDNWRMLHMAGGCNPEHHRLVHRTTIAGDYGLGYFEGASPNR